MRLNLILIQTILVLLGATLFFALPALSDDPASTIDQDLKTRIATKPCSVKVLVGLGNSVVLRREYGQSGRHQGAITGEVENRFPIGTIAEQFVAATVLHLKEQGKLTIDASICSYLQSCPTGWSEIQVVHLLTHTSGLPPIKKPSPGQMMPAVPHTLGELLVDAYGESLEFKPGTMFKYNTLDFPVLYLLIGSVTGRLPTEYIETEIFRPLSMKDTRFSTSDELSRSLRRSHLPDAQSRTPRETQSCDDNLCSTVEDLYRWEQALATGKVISHDSVRQMFTPYRDGYGFGWKIIKEFDKRIALQSGRSDTFSVSVRLYPDDDTYIVLVARGENVDSAELTHDISAILFEKHHPASSKRDGASSILPK